MKKIKKYAIILAFVLNLLIIIGFWWSGSSFLLWGKTSDVLLSLGRITGLLGVYCILLQFLLIGRTPWMESTFGLDKLAKIHRLNGYFSMLFILLHPIFLIFSTSIITKSGFWKVLKDQLTLSDDLLKAGISVLLFLAVVFSSITISRKRLAYETWYFVHLLTYLAVLLAFGHQLDFGGDFLKSPAFTAYWYAAYLFVLGNFIYSRFLKPLYLLKKHGFTVEKIIRENSDTVSITISGKKLDQWKVEAGQFINVRFLSKNFRWQSHPFSISALPRDNRFRITIKNLGDFTAQIPNIPLATRILIEGPFGTFTPCPNPTKYLLIAGGVGITPIKCLSEKIAPENDVILLYCNRTTEDILFQKEFTELAQKNRTKIHYIMSQEENYSGEKGRIDEEKIQRLVPDIASRHTYLCGPVPMMESTIAILQKIGISKERIHFERFGW